MNKKKLLIGTIIVLLGLVILLLLKNPNIEELFESTPEQNVEETTNNPVFSPDSSHSAQLISDGEVPSLFIDGEKKSIDENVFHMQWLNDDALIYSKSAGGISEIIRYSITANEQVTLIHKESELMGFEILNDIILFTSTIDVGFIRIEDDSHEMLLSFNQPIRGSDEPYVPNIIPNQDRTGATVEILDENYLDTQKIRYIVVNNTGEIISNQSN